MSSEIDLAYLAGIVDADGHITINRSVRAGRVYFGAVIGISGTRREPHDLAASLWGGGVGSYAGTEAHHLPCFQWSRQGRSAATAIEALLPYLRIKADQAHLALALHEHVLAGRSDDPYPWLSPGYDPTDELEAMVSGMRALNQWRRRDKKLSEKA